MPYKGEPGEQGEHGDQGEQGVQGERGPSGDSGAEGPTGPAGLTGVIGPIGIIGERGRTGDQGQHGQPGEPGKTGETGHIGETGQPGTPAPSMQRRLLMLYLFLVAAVLVYGFILTDTVGTLKDTVREVRDNSQRIGDVLDTARYEGCIGGVATVEAYNARLLVLADIERRRQARETDPVERGLLQEEIDSYVTGVLPVPDCESLKPS